MATLAQSQSRSSSISSSGQSSTYASSLNSSCSATGGGILANAHEAPKKTIKPLDSGFTSALKNAFIPPQPGKQMKCTGKPLGKSFRRTSPLPTKGHDGGEVLKRDPRGQNAAVGDGVVLSSDSDGEEDDQVSSWSAGTDTTSPSASSSGDAPTQDTAWTGKHYGRGRSDTASTDMSRLSRSSDASSNNPCKIKFCPLPSSGRLKRANSITIGVAARSHLLQSQGSARVNDNTAAWQAQANAQRYQSNGASNQQGPPQNNVNRQAGVVRHNDTVDLGEELRKGMLKAFRKIRRGSSVSEGSAAGNENDAVKKGEEMTEEEDYYELAGEKTPKRSDSPPRMSSHLKDDLQDQEEAEGTQTPRHNLQRRLSTGAFTGNNSFLEIEERRKRGSIGETDADREEVANFAEQLGQTHANKVAHHTGGGSWYASLMPTWGGEEEKAASGTSSTTSVNSEYVDADDDDDPEAQEAERLADESLRSHSDKATKAGAVERMEHHHR